MHSWVCPCRSPTPGAGWTPPDVLYIFQNATVYQIATYIISSQFCRKNFALKCIPGPLPIGVLPLGQGGRHPRCPGGSGNFSERYLYHFKQVL